VRQQEEAEAESRDGQGGADGPLNHAGAMPGPDAGPQAVLMLRLERSVFLGVAHHPRQLPFEVIHGLPFTPPAR
jgi:hypothetical protein